MRSARERVNIDALPPPFRNESRASGNAPRRPKRARLPHAGILAHPRRRPADGSTLAVCRARMRRASPILLTLLALTAFAGCGDDDSASGAAQTSTTAAATTTTPATTSTAATTTPATTAG